MCSRHQPSPLAVAAPRCVNDKNQFGGNDGGCRPTRAAFVVAAAAAAAAASMARLTSDADERPARRTASGAYKTRRFCCIATKRSSDNWRAAAVAHVLFVSLCADDSRSVRIASAAIKCDSSPTRRCTNLAPSASQTREHDASARRPLAAGRHDARCV